MADVERARGLLGALRELDDSLRDQGHAPRGTIVVAAHGVVLPVSIHLSGRITLHLRITEQQIMPVNIGDHDAVD